MRRFLAMLRDSIKFKGSMRELLAGLIWFDYGSTQKSNMTIRLTDHCHASKAWPLVEFASVTPEASKRIISRAGGRIGRNWSPGTSVGICCP
jgi:hypothetical protein